MIRPQHEKAVRLGVCLLGLLLSPPAALAKRIVLWGFDGAAHVAARTALARSLRKQHIIVPRHAFMPVARQLRLSSGCSPVAVATLARAVSADAVICGSRSGRLLVVEVFNGGNGERLTTLRFRVARRGLDPRTLRQLVLQLESTLAQSWSSDAVALYTPDADGVSPPPRPALLERHTPAAVYQPPDWGSDITDLYPDARHRIPREAPVPVASVRSGAERRTASGHALRLAVGPAFLWRRTFGVHDAPTLPDARGWKTPAAPGVGVVAEVFPAAWVSPGWASHLGVALSYARYFNLPGEESDAVHQVLAADVRGRYALHLGERSIVLLARAGYRHLLFAMSDAAGAPALIPDVAFSSLDLGLDVEVELLPRWLAANAGFTYMLVLGRGEIVTSDGYGPGSGGGLLFSGGLQGAIIGRFGWSAGVSYTRYTVVFDGDPTAAHHAREAVDRYLSGAVSLTFSH